MTEWNFETLKENIRKHMSDKHMTQKNVAEALKTTQANVAKHLKKGDNAQTFTLKQVWQLADLFGTSVDELLGREKSERDYSPEEICSFLRVLVEKHKIQCKKQTIAEEDVWDYGDEFQFSPTIEYRKRRAEYWAFYFPDYLPIPPCNDPDEYHVYLQEYEECGNFCRENIQTNKFLEKFLSAFNDYELGKHNQEVYSIVVKAYYDDLKKTMERIRS